MVAKPHQCLAALTRPPSGHATPSAVFARSKARAVAAGASLILMPEAPDKFGVPKLWLGNANNGSLRYTYSDHRSSFHWLCGYGLEA